MTETELDEKIEKLEKKRGGFRRNRNISAVATAYLIYSFYTTLAEENPPIWFIIAMGAIVLTCGGICAYGHLTIKKIESELFPLYDEQNAIKEQNSDSE